MANSLTVVGVTVSFNSDSTLVRKDLVSLLNELKKLSMSKILADNTSIKTTNAELIKGQQAAALLGIALKEATNVNTGKLDLTKFNKGLGKMGVNLATIRKSLHTMGTDGQEAFLKLTNLLLLADIVLQNSTGLLNKFILSLKNVAQYQISTALFTSLISSISDAYTFTKLLNESLTNILMVTMKSTEDMKEFALQANKAARGLGITTKLYTDAALIYYQLGLSDEEVKARNETTIKAANVAGTSALEMSQYLTAVWNSYQVGSTELERYADVMTALGAGTATSLEEIATAMSKVGAAGHTMNVSFEQLSAMVATVSSTTRESAETIGNSFKTILARMGDLKLKGSIIDDDGLEVKLGKVSGELKKIGVNVLDVNGLMRDGGAIIDDLMKRWNLLDEGQRQAAAVLIAGKLQYTRLMALLDNLEMYRLALDIANSSAGDLEKRNEIYEKSWEATAKKVKASAESLYLSLLNDEFFISFNKELAEVIDKVKALVETFGGLKGILFTVLALFTKINLANISASITTGLNNIALKFRGVDYQLRQRQQIAQQRYIAMQNTYSDSGYDNYTLGGKNLKTLSSNLLDKETAIAAVEELLYLAKKEGHTYEYLILLFKKQLLEAIRDQVKADTELLYQKETEISDYKNSISKRLNLVIKLLLQLKNIAQTTLLNNFNNAELAYNNKLGQMLSYAMSHPNTYASSQIYMDLDEEAKILRRELEKAKNNLVSFDISVAENSEAYKKLTQQIKELKLLNAEDGENIKNLITERKKLREKLIINNKNFMSTKMTNDILVYKNYGKNVQTNSQMSNSVLALGSNLAQEQNLELAKIKTANLLYILLILEESAGHTANLLALQVRKNALLANGKTLNDLTEEEKKDLIEIDNKIKEEYEYSQALNEEELKLTNSFIGKNGLITENFGQIQPNIDYNEIPRLLDDEFQQRGPESINVTEALGDSLAKAANGATSLAMGINSINIALDALNNEDMSFGLKFLTITMSLSMGISGIVSGILSLLAAKAALVPVAAALKSISLELMLANSQELLSTAALAVLEGKLTAAEAIRIVTMRGATAQTVADTIANKANSASLEENSIANEINMLSITKRVAVLAASVAIMVIGFKKLKDTLNSLSVRKLKRELEQISEELDKINSDTSSTKNVFEELEEANKKLKNLTKGTKEWRMALNEAKLAGLKAIEALLDKELPEGKTISDYITKNAEGYYDINEKNYEELLEYLSNKQVEAQEKKNNYSSAVSALEAYEEFAKLLKKFGSGGKSEDKIVKEMPHIDLNTYLNVEQLAEHFGVKLKNLSENEIKELGDSFKKLKLKADAVDYTEINLGDTLSNLAEDKEALTSVLITIAATVGGIVAFISGVLQIVEFILNNGAGIGRFLTGTVGPFLSSIGSFFSSIFGSITSFLTGTIGPMLSTLVASAGGILPLLGEILVAIMALAELNAFAHITKELFDTNKDDLLAKDISGLELLKHKEIQEGLTPEEQEAKEKLEEKIEKGKENKNKRDRKDAYTKGITTLVDAYNPLTWFTNGGITDQEYKSNYDEYNAVIRNFNKEGFDFNPNISYDKLLEKILGLLNDPNYDKYSTDLEHLQKVIYNLKGTSKDASDAANDLGGAIDDAGDAMEEASSEAELVARAIANFVPDKFYAEDPKKNVNATLDILNHVKVIDTHIAVIKNKMSDVLAIIKLTDNNKLLAEYSEKELALMRENEIAYREAKALADEAGVLITAEGEIIGQYDRDVKRIQEQNALEQEQTNEKNEYELDKAIRNAKKQANKEDNAGEDNKEERDAREKELEREQEDADTAHKWQEQAFEDRQNALEELDKALEMLQEYSELLLSNTEELASIRRQKLDLVIENLKLEFLKLEEQMKAAQVTLDKIALWESGDSEGFMQLYQSDLWQSKSQETLDIYLDMVSYAWLNIPSLGALMNAIIPGSGDIDENGLYKRSAVKARNENYSNLSEEDLDKFKELAEEMEVFQTELLEAEKAIILTQMDIVNRKLQKIEKLLEEGNVKLSMLNNEVSLIEAQNTTLVTTALAVNELIALIGVYANLLQTVMQLLNNYDEQIDKLHNEILKNYGLDLSNAAEAEKALYDVARSLEGLTDIPEDLKQALFELTRTIETLQNLYLKKLEKQIELAGIEGNIILAIIDKVEAIYNGIEKITNAIKRQLETLSTLEGSDPLGLNGKGYYNQWLKVQNEIAMSRRDTEARAWSDILEATAILKDAGLSIHYNSLTGQLDYASLKAIENFDPNTITNAVLRINTTAAIKVLEEATENLAEARNEDILFALDKVRKRLDMVAKSLERFLFGIDKVNFSIQKLDKVLERTANVLDYRNLVDLSTAKYYEQNANLTHRINRTKGAMGDDLTSINLLISLTIGKEYAITKDDLDEEGIASSKKIDAIYDAVNNYTLREGYDENAAILIDLLSMTLEDYMNHASSVWSDLLEVEENLLRILENTLKKINKLLETRNQLTENELTLLNLYKEGLTDSVRDSTVMFSAIGSEMDYTTRKIENVKDAWEEMLASEDLNDSQRVEMTLEYFDSLAESIGGLRDEMEEYKGAFANALDGQIEKLSKLEDRFSRILDILESYKNIADLTGLNFDEEYMDDLVNTLAKVSLSQFRAAQDEYNSAAAIFNEWEEKRKNYTGREDELFDEMGWQEAYEFMMDKLQEMLDKGISWGEALQAVRERQLDKIASSLEKSLSGDTWDNLNAKMDNLLAYDNDMLTKTNLQYETLKLIRTANIDLDKTESQWAKNKLRIFMEETKELQKQKELSLFELDILKAKYEVLLAEIALREAQDNKSKVRLLRDTEGNFNYVYTADEGAVDSAQQALEDKLNELYNLLREGANKFAEQMALEELAFYEDMESIRNNNLLSDDEKLTLMELRRREHFENIKRYLNLYNIAADELGAKETEAYGSLIKARISSADEFKAASTEAITATKETFLEYHREVQNLAPMIEGNFADMKNESRATLSAVRALDEEGTLYLKALTDYVTDSGILRISILEEEINTYRSLMATMKEYQELVTGEKVEIDYFDQFLNHSGYNIAAMQENLHLHDMKVDANPEKYGEYADTINQYDFAEEIMYSDTLLDAVTNAARREAKILNQGIDVKSMGWETTYEMLLKRFKKGTSGKEQLIYQWLLTQEELGTNGGTEGLLSILDNLVKNWEGNAINMPKGTYTTDYVSTKGNQLLTYNSGVNRSDPNSIRQDGSVPVEYDERYRTWENEALTYQQLITNFAEELANREKISGVVENIAPVVEQMNVSVEKGVEAAETIMSAVPPIVAALTSGGAGIITTLTTGFGQVIGAITTTARSGNNLDFNSLMGAFTNGASLLVN